MKFSTILTELLIKSDIIISDNIEEKTELIINILKREKEQDDFT